MTKQELIGQKFATVGEGKGKSAWVIIGVMPNNNLELKPIRYAKSLRYRPLLGDRIGFFYGKWHMPVPTAFGEIVW